ncbi:MAG: 16S rRNA (guanine(966)-N(2))-methyltransferase RsmD [Sulfurospirillum sp.]|nr:MAG: 16S rRNA (guanine(966)-N(2))-methyltransferase RsmD [Sulfurospirillum sp.]
MKKHDLTFTIIGGAFKGKKLPLPSKETTRATKSIIRGSVFDTLQFEIVDEIFVELFGGSGSMGLEALSRGAKKVYFFEKNRAAAKILAQNAAALDPKRTQLIQGDAFENFPLLADSLRAQGRQAFLYIDPPFDIREGMEGIYAQTEQLIAAIPPEIVLRIIVEHMSSVKFADKIGPFIKQKSKKFGKTTLTYYSVA